MENKENPNRSDDVTRRDIKRVVSRTRLVMVSMLIVAIPIFIFLDDILDPPYLPRDGTGGQAVSSGSRIDNLAGYAGVAYFHKKIAHLLYFLDRF
jgi:hypothetical protein